MVCIFSDNNSTLYYGVTKLIQAAPVFYVIATLWFPHHKQDGMNSLKVKLVCININFLCTKSKKSDFFFSQKLSSLKGTQYT